MAGSMPISMQVLVIATGALVCWAWWDEIIRPYWAMLMRQSQLVLFALVMPWAVAVLIVIAISADLAVKLIY